MVLRIPISAKLIFLKNKKKFIEKEPAYITCLT